MTTAARPRLLTRIARRLTPNTVDADSPRVRLAELHTEVDAVLDDPRTLVEHPMLFDTDLACVEQFHVDNNRAISDPTDSNVLAAILSWRVARDSVRLRGQRTAPMTPSQRAAMNRAKDIMAAHPHVTDVRTVAQLMSTAGYARSAQEFLARR